MRVAAGRGKRGRVQYPHDTHVGHPDCVPVADGLVEGSGELEPGERESGVSASGQVSDERSERERVWAGERRAVEVNTHMPFIPRNSAVFQSPMGWLKAAAP